MPGESLRPRRLPPRPPHIYTRDEVRALLAGGPHPPIRPTFTPHLLHLRLDSERSLTLPTTPPSRRTASRSPVTLDALRRYHDRRVAVAPADLTGAFFVSGRGTGYSTSTVQALFRDLTVQTGLREPDGRGPRLHDLRATFAVTRLLLWYRDGQDVMARLPLLSTYLGHACVSDTEVYLEIDMAMKRKAIERCPPLVPDPEGETRWHVNKDIIQWLEDL